MRHRLDHTLRTRGAEPRGQIIWITSHILHCPCDLSFLLSFSYLLHLLPAFLPPHPCSRILLISFIMKTGTANIVGCCVPEQSVLISPYHGLFFFNLLSQYIVGKRHRRKKFVGGQVVRCESGFGRRRSVRQGWHSLLPCFILNQMEQKQNKNLYFYADRRIMVGRFLTTYGSHPWILIILDKHYLTAV